MPNIENLWPGGKSDPRRRVSSRTATFKVHRSPSWNDLLQLARSRFCLQRKRKPSPDQLAATWRHQCTNYDDCDAAEGRIREHADNIFLAHYEKYLPHGFQPTRHWD